MRGQDYKSYEQYYDIGINPIIVELQRKYSNVLVKKEAKEEIWLEYKFFNDLCKGHMREHENLLDRHKVVACYMCAIEKAGVLLQTDAFQIGDDSLLLLNERLAMTFGMSLLRSLIVDMAEKLKQKDIKDKVLEAFDNDIAFPKCTHGEHKDNILWQLFYTRKDNSYNVLLLAEMLYLLECYNLMKCGIEEDCLKLDNLL